MANSAKHAMISQAQLRVVAAISLTVFVVVFSLVASKALLSQRSYQARVIEAREKARDQLEANIKAVETVTASYEQFVSSTENAIGGNPAGTGERDGDNARIVTK